MNTTTAPQTVLHIKNMVCDRCRMAVEQLLQRHEVAFDRVELGKAVLSRPLTDDQLTHLRHDLEQVGFELIDDHRSVLMEAIRQAVMDYVADRALMEKWKLSAFLSDRLAKSYSSLGAIFSAARGMTIERFFICKSGTRQRTADLRRTDDVGNRFSPQLFESGSSERTIQTNHRHVAFGLQTSRR